MPEFGGCPLENSRLNSLGQAHLTLMPVVDDSTGKQERRVIPVRALIIDDSSVMRKVIERALRQAGLDLTEVLQASNGQEALEVLQSDGDGTEKLGLIISDINMPIMDGLQFLELRRDRKLAPGVPVVMITTEGGEPFVLRAIAAGAQGYICKPFTADQVKARVLPLVNAA